MATPTQETRSLPVRLTAEEFNARAAALAETCTKIEIEDTRQTNLKAQLKADMARLEAEQSKLAHIVARREEYREVPVDWMYDGKRGIVELSRRDTGEIVETRPATDKDRQLALPVDARPPKRSRATDRQSEAAGDVPPRDV